MSGAKHSPGPWYAASDSLSVHVPGGAPVCRMGGNVSSEHATESNAYLVAAAPDMLDQLRQTLWFFDQRLEMMRAAWWRPAAEFIDAERPSVDEAKRREALRAVIAQAAGGQS